MQQLHTSQKHSYSLKYKGGRAEVQDQIVEDQNELPFEPEKYSDDE